MLIDWEIRFLPWFPPNAFFAQSCAAQTYEFEGQETVPAGGVRRKMPLPVSNFRKCGNLPFSTSPACRSSPRA